MTLSALDRHFQKMQKTSAGGSKTNAHHPKRFASAGDAPMRTPRRTRSAKKPSTGTKLSELKIEEDFSQHFGVEEDDNVSINTTNTANIRISRKARGQQQGTGAGGGTVSDGQGGVVTKNLVKNFRLSRNHSRVVYSRSPSPSRKLLAAEIAVAAAKREKDGPVVPDPPPLEQTPLLLMRFTNKATSGLIGSVENRLRQHGLLIYDKVEDTDEPHYTYLYLSAAQEALETFAEQTRWMKRTNDTKVVEHFTVATRRKFVTKKSKRRNPRNNKKSRSLDKDDPEMDSSAHNNNAHSKTMGGDDLFTSNEWCHLAFRLLDSVEVYVENESESCKDLNLVMMLRDENQVQPLPPPEPALQRRGTRPVLPRQGSSSRSVAPGSMPNRRDFRRQTSMGNLTPGSSRRDLMSGGGGANPLSPPTSPGRGTQSPTSPIDRRRNLRRQKSLMMQHVSQHGKRSSCLRHVLQANEFVDVVTPVHWGPARKHIVQETLSPTQLMPPVQDIRNYYGEDVAFYFAWMGTLSNWLVVLGGMGAVTVALQIIRDDELDEDEFTPMYGLFTFLWGVLFLRFWERHEHRLAYRWGTYSVSLFDSAHRHTMRPEFKGIVRISPVTGDYETYYPPNQRRLQYGVSGLVTLVMLVFAFWMMIMSLNMQGFVHPEKNPDRWNEENPHPFHYPWFAMLSEKGYIFDATHPWKSFLPSVLHVALIFTLNNVYRVIAEGLTEWENHETESSYKNSLIVKRFLFEAFDCYVALFYLAFYERDVDRLHMELVTVFNIDTFRRLAMECFIPLLAQKVHKWLHPHQAHHLVSEADQEMAEEAEEVALLAENGEPMLLADDSTPGLKEMEGSNKDESEKRMGDESMGDSSRDLVNNLLGASTTDLLGESSYGDLGESSAFMMGDSCDQSSHKRQPEQPRRRISAADAFKKFASEGDGKGASPGSTSSDATPAESKPPQDRSDRKSNRRRATATKKKKPRRKSMNGHLTSKDEKPSQKRAQELVVGYSPPTMEDLAEEADYEEYEAFDDYMEIVIQFGYVTLFASAYPLASLVALAANWVEVRSDCFKLAKVCRRPRSYRADGIGVWKTLLSCVVWMSALTNCLIVGFTSDQMREFFPAFYVDDGHGDSRLVDDKGWIAVFVIFGLERILIVMGLLIHAIVPVVPEDVHDEVERLHYIRAQEHEDVIRHVMRKRANKKKN